MGRSEVSERQEWLQKTWSRLPKDKLRSPWLAGTVNIVSSWPPGADRSNPWGVRV